MLRKIRPSLEREQVSCDVDVYHQFTDRHLRNIIFLSVNFQFANVEQW